MALGYQGLIKDGSRTGLTYRGEEILLQKPRGRRGLSKEHRRLPTAPGWYPEDIRLYAATIFAATLNVSETAELTGVDAKDLRKWRKEPWFLAILDEVRQENNDRLDQKFNTVMEKALTGMEDRITNGNDQLNQKTGQMIKVPVPLRDLTQAHASILEKRQLLRGQPTSRSESGNIGDKLEKLAEEFLKIASAKKRKTEIIDVAVVS